MKRTILKPRTLAGRFAGGDLIGMLTASLPICDVQAQDKPAVSRLEPQGGQPPRGAKQSVTDLEEQIAYQRAFEAVLWAMPASAIYRFRVGMLELPGMADNVIAASFAPLATKQEFITA